jgi:hypothetical protein
MSAESLLVESVGVGAYDEDREDQFSEASVGTYVGDRIMTRDRRLC